MSTPRNIPVTALVGQWVRWADSVLATFPAEMQVTLEQEIGKIRRVAMQGNRVIAVVYWLHTGEAVDCNISSLKLEQNT